MKHSSIYERSRQKPEKFLTVGQVEKRSGMSKSHIYNLISCGDLKAVKFGNKKGYRIKESDFDSFIKKSIVNND